MGAKSWYTAKQVITEALALVGDFEQKQYEMAVLLFMRSYRDFNLFHNTSFTKVWLPVTSIKTVSLPDDFIELVYVGTQINGEVWTFTKNARILSPSDPLQQTLNTARSEDSNLSVSPLTGYSAKGVNESGYFSLNMQSNRIELRQAFLDLYNQSDMTEVYLGYIGTNITDINTTYVPTNAVNMITCDIARNLALSDPKPNPFMIQTRQRQYEIEALKYDALSLPSADELLDAIYQTSGQNLR